MFKKTLVAVSLLAAFSASAITVNHDGTKYTDPALYSAEGNALSDVTTMDAPAVVATLGAATYLVGDTITLTFTGATFDIATGFPTLEIISGTDQDHTTAANALTSNAATLTVKTATTNSVTYQVATVVNSTKSAPEDTFVGSKLVVDGKTTIASGDFVFDSTSITGSVSLDVTAARGASAIDNAPTAKSSPVLLKSAEQFTGTVSTKLNGTIDVNTLRTTFTGNGVTDTLKLTVADSTPALNAATASKVAYTVNGDFAFLDSDATKDGIQLVDTSRVAVDSSPTDLKVEADKITWSAATVGAPTLTINVSDKDGKAAPAALAPQPYTASAVVTYKVNTVTGTKSVLSSADAGSWTLNGAQANIPSMPFGDAYAQYITVSNTSEQDGDIEVDMYIDGVKSTHSLTAKAAKQAVTNISAELRDLVAAAGATDANVAFDIVVNAPSDNVLVSALYYVKSDADRAVMSVVNK